MIIYENMRDCVKIADYLPCCDGGCHFNNYLKIVVHSVSCVSKYEDITDTFSLEDNVSKVSPYIYFTVCIHDGYHHQIPCDSCFCITQLRNNTWLLEGYNNLKKSLNKEIKTGTDLWSREAAPRHELRSRAKPEPRL